MGRLTAIVLGAAAGGAFPQWNCRCAVCRLAWAGDPRAQPRTQASLAVSADGEHWTLINASPDLLAQLRATPALQPRTGVRHSPIAAVVLTGGEVDQTAGLLNLRESQPFHLFATTDTLGTLATNSIFAVLRADLVPRTRIVPGEAFRLPGGVEAEAFAVPGKVPLYLEGEAPDTVLESEVNIGLELRAGSARIAYVPGAAAVPNALRARLAAADVLLFDGTLFTDDEMIRNGTGVKSGRRMGHMPIDGPQGTLAVLDGLANRRILVHINNTNPILVDGSPERRRVEAAGWEVADDGLEIVL